ncbi:MAG: hypothetical protein OEZ20_06960 [candidate division WOR-3 bacterium]|nr:hypothetical protein [candidate division WOR-3 bacterium]MDH5684185.1 hypothetical protein [candidate division WOR-3 bacterium]
MKSTFPPFVISLFWDVRKGTVDIERHSPFIIRRVLNFGDVAALNWLRKTFHEDRLEQVVKTKRGLTPKTLAFWTTYFGIKSVG